jgi:hypothetical protein
VRYVEQAGGRSVSPAEAFDVLVLANQSGHPFLETVDLALNTLFRLLDRQRPVHLVLPNPDVLYPGADGGVGIASGSVATMFEAALQWRYPHRPELRFTRLGKPQAVVYVNHAANECGLSQRGGALSSLLSAGLEVGVYLLTPPVFAGRGHKSLAENADLPQR